MSPLCIQCLDSNPITYESTVRETATFLGDASKTPAFVDKGIDAAIMITNTYRERYKIDAPPLTRSRYGQASPEVLRQREIQRQLEDSQVS